MQEDFSSKRLPCRVIYKSGKITEDIFELPHKDDLYVFLYDNEESEYSYRDVHVDDFKYIIHDVYISPNGRCCFVFFYKDGEIKYSTYCTNEEIAKLRDIPYTEEMVLRTKLGE